MMMTRSPSVGCITTKSATESSSYVMWKESNAAKSATKRAKQAFCPDLIIPGPSMTSRSSQAVRRLIAGPKMRMYEHM